MLTSTSFSVYISLHSVLQMKKLMKKMKMNYIEQLQEVIIHKTVVKVNQPWPKVVNNVKNLNGQKKIICTNQLSGRAGWESLAI